MMFCTYCGKDAHCGGLLEGKLACEECLDNDIEKQKHKKGKSIMDFVRELERN